MPTLGIVHHPAPLVDRRELLRRSLAGAGAIALGSASRPAALAAPARRGPGPYGALLEADDDGVRLPRGFRARVVARSGRPVGDTGHTWHADPDGGATFATRDGGWIYVSNSETGGTAGGVGALRFDPDGRIVDAYPILEGTSRNCAGGPTPWGTWLSCEEHSDGRVWECDPTGREAAAARPALGTFVHEAVAVDPEGERLHLTEDHPGGRYYRFTPDTYPDLSAGTLEVAAVGDDGSVTWLAVPDPSGDAAPTREQVPESTAFDGGEGIWYDDGSAFFTTKGDGRVWRHDLARDRITVLYDPRDFDDPVLTGVDNVTVGDTGAVFVAEDGGDMQLVLISAGDHVVAPFLQVVGHQGSEITGPAFDPSSNRLYCSSQRGADGDGVTYEVSGPFRRDETGRGTDEPTTTSIPRAIRDPGTPSDGPPEGSSGGSSGVPPGAAGLGLAALGAAALGLAARRTRVSKSP